MKFIDSSFEIIKQQPNLIGLYKHVERIARTSYKSEDKITEDSAKKMVDTLIKNKHLACLEHGTIYLRYVYDFNGDPELPIDDYKSNPYSRVTSKWIDNDKLEYYITTNARVIIENGWESDLQYMCEPTEYHAKRYTVKFITSIGIGREFTRHRKFSFMQESTRYVNYSKDKFGSEITYIIPQWIYDIQSERASHINPLTHESQEYLMDLRGMELIDELICVDRSVSAWYECLAHMEIDYMYLISTDEGYKLKPQEARGILPLDTKSELIMTGFIEDWIHFFRLRSHIAATGKPHPDAQILADSLMDEFINRKYCTYEQIKEGN